MTRPCETCGGEGTVIEFRRFAGEYMAGEPVEVPCPDCDGTGEDEQAIARPPYTPSADYLEFCREADLRKAERAELDPKKRPDGRWEVAA